MALQAVSLKVDLQQLSIEILRASLEHERISQSEYKLESVYRLNLQGSRLGIRMANGLLSVNVSARNLLVEDTRPLSRDFAFKEIVSTLYDRADWQPFIDKAPITPKDSFFIRSQATRTCHDLTRT